MSKDPINTEENQNDPATARRALTASDNPSTTRVLVGGSPEVKLILKKNESKTMLTNDQVESVKNDIEQNAIMALMKDEARNKYKKMMLGELRRLENTDLKFSNDMTPKLWIATRLVSCIMNKDISIYGSCFQEVLQMQRSWWHQGPKSVGNVPEVKKYPRIPSNQEVNVEDVKKGLFAEIARMQKNDASYTDDANFISFKLFLFNALLKELNKGSDISSNIGALRQALTAIYAMRRYKDSPAKLEKNTSSEAFSAFWCVRLSHYPIPKSESNVMSVDAQSKEQNNSAGVASDAVKIKKVAFNPKLDIRLP